MPAILAGVFDGDVDAIKEIIENKRLYCFTRISALRVLTILVLDGKLQREYVMDYFRTLLKEAKNEDEDVIGAIVSECCDLYPKEAMEEIKAAFKKGIVALDYIDLDYVKSVLKMPLDEVIEQSKKNWHCTMIDDIVYEFDDFCCFNDIDNVLEELGYDDETNYDFNNSWDELKPIAKSTKVGRNDPCPCGSGKKYKKCCGK